MKLMLELTTVAFTPLHHDYYFLFSNFLHINKIKISGTHWYDFGIIVLEKEVNFGGKPGRGACLGFSKLSGNCMTVGYDTNDDFGSVSLCVLYLLL